jgi:Mannosylglycerate hydrolase MGH1-like glycoside hydrolase domain
VTLGHRGRPSWRALALPLAAAAILATLVVFLVRRQPTPKPVPPAPPLPASDAPFRAWLKFEPAANRDQARLQDYFIDAMLEHQVFQIPPQDLPPSEAHEAMLDDDKLLLSSGRRLWNKELLHQPGLAGKFCYLHSSFCVKRLFDVEFFVDGKPVPIYENQFRIQRAPSHTRVTYVLPGVRVDETKFITWDDRAVCSYHVESTDKQAHQVNIEVLAPYLTMPRAEAAAYPLLGAGTFQTIPLFVYLDAPGFARSDGAAVHLHRTLSVAAAAPTAATAPAADAQVAVSFENQRRSAAVADLPSDLFVRHQREYNRWFFDNVPYFDASDPGFKKMWYYRWWVVRFNMAQADTPDLSGYRFYEGKLGFDNVISFAVPVQLKELAYLRDPIFGLQQAQNSYRNLSPQGAVVDPPGIAYWGETYSHWIAAALAEFHRVHPIPADQLRALLPAMARDVRAWTTVYDPDHDWLPQRAPPRVTGYDLDILSFWYFSGLKLDLDARLQDMERVDFASFVYANARAVAELARAVNDAALAQEFDGVADHIRTATLQHLWDPQTHFFYPQRAVDDARIPIRELHGFFPFTTLLAPDEPQYVEALKKFVDPEEFWSTYPPVIASQYYYRHWTWEMDGLTRNIAPHPISMGARTALQVLKHYKQDSITPDNFMELMARYTALMYPGVNPYDPLWRPDAHEYYSKWEPHQVSPRPKPSDISHDFHSMYCSLVVEGVVGLTPRNDEKIELQPAALGWTYFVLDRLRYHGKDLTIVWDQPDGTARYSGYPEGFSLYVDGKSAFTRDHLSHVLYDPATGAVTELAGPAA